MPKIKFKPYSSYTEEEIYEVYGVRTYDQNYREYDNTYSEEVTEFFIYSYGSWSWVDAKNYEPVD